MKSTVRSGIALSFLLLVGCSRETVYACDLFAGQTCTVRPPSIYDVPAPKGKPIETWTDFSHHLYFHSAITPGLRLQRSDLKKNEVHACHFRLSDPEQRYRPVEGELEGLRLDQDGLWCFDYLGSQLLMFVRENGIENEPVDLRLFPLILTIHGSIGEQPEPQIQRPIELHPVGWNP